MPCGGLTGGVFPVPPGLVAPPPPPDPPGPPAWLGSLLFPPRPPPADVIVEKIEFAPLVLSAPPPPTVIGKAVAVTVNAVPCKGDGPNPEAL